MRSSEVFSFIQGLFEDDTLPQGRNLWGIAYNMDRYPAAKNAAARHGMEDYRFELWLKEYARRSMSEASLMLPVVVRWGEQERPYRALVQVPMYSMKDFDSLSDAAEAALMLAVDADAGEEVCMRPMRAPDVPEVWARVVVNGEEMEVQFNPVKLWRQEVRPFGGECYLKQVRVLEWRVVGKVPEVREARPGAVLPPVPSSPVGGWVSRHGKLLAWLVAALLGALAVVSVLPDDAPQKPRKPAAGKGVKKKKKKSVQPGVLDPREVRRGMRLQCDGVAFRRYLPARDYAAMLREGNDAGSRALLDATPLEDFAILKKKPVDVLQVSGDVVRVLSEGAEWWVLVWSLER